MERQALASGNKDMALFFLGIVYSLTEADEVGKLIEQIKEKQ